MKLSSAYPSNKKIAFIILNYALEVSPTIKELIGFFQENNFQVDIVTDKLHRDKNFSIRGVNLITLDSLPSDIKAYKELLNNYEYLFAIEYLALTFLSEINIPLSNVIYLSLESTQLMLKEPKEITLNKLNQCMFGVIQSKERYDDFYKYFGGQLKLQFEYLPVSIRPVSINCEKNSAKIIYSGYLSEWSGMLEFLSLFKSSRYQSYFELTIQGHSIGTESYVKELRKASDKIENIKIDTGFFNDKDHIKLLSEQNIGIAVYKNLDNSANWDNLLFSSGKIAAYLWTGCAVITNLEHELTKKPPFIYIKDLNDIVSLERGFENYINNIELYYNESLKLAQKYYNLNTYAVSIMNRLYPTSMSLNNMIKIYKQNELDIRSGENNSNSLTNGEYNFINKVIQPNSTVFDVGANIGEWSGTVYKGKSGVSITSFEPVPEIFSTLKKNLDGLPVKLENLAMSSSEGAEKFFYYNQQSDRFSALSTFYRRKGAEKDLNISPREVEVKKTTLDSYCSKNNIAKIDFLKIDTEGSEKDVLTGAQNLLKECRINVLQFEYGGTYIDAEITLKDVIQLLAFNKYRVFKIVPDGLINISQWSDELENYQYANYCAVSPLAAPDFNVTTFPVTSKLVKENSVLKLHLGCGQKYLDGYLNIDYPPTEHSVQQNAKVDLYADITKLEYAENSVDEIRLHHVFEHFDRPAALALLCKWHQWLKIGGKLVIETPDLEESMNLLQSPSLNYIQKQSVMRHVFGSHEAGWAVHYDGWYKEKFKHVFTSMYYKVVSVEKSEWQLTRNITVIAEKQNNISVDELKKSAYAILAESKVDDSPSERILHKIWNDNFDKAISPSPAPGMMAIQKKEVKTIAVKSSDEPVVSVFMPVYNGEKYIAETIESLLNQTFSAFELIIVDDGSTDNTLGIATEYAKRDSRIKVFSIEHKGEVNARNFALTRVNPSSRYLMNHDSDDISLPHKLEKLVSYLDLHPDIAIAGCAAEYFDNEGNLKGKPTIECDPAKIRETFNLFNSMINSAALIRKEVFNKTGNYREEFKSVDDYDFFSRALIAGFNLTNLNEILHRIRLHKNSIGSKRAETQKKLSAKIANLYYWSLNKKNIKNYKLHLGCGDVHLDNFVNVDIDPALNAVDVIDDIKELKNFDNNSAGLIYACHVLEHFPNDEVKGILARWFEVLNYGGQIRISVPDIDRIVDIYQRNKKHFLTPGNTPWIGLLYGGQTDIYDFHKTGFNFTYLKYLLESVGFTDVEEYPHSPHWLGIAGDASMANQPFNEYISLNITAKKTAADSLSKKDEPVYQTQKPEVQTAKTVKAPNKRVNVVSEKHLNILHTVEFYHPHTGGAELVIQQLSERLVKRGHSVTVATTKIAERNFSELNGVDVVEFDIKGSLGVGISGNDIKKYQEFLTTNPSDVMMNYAAQQWGTDVVFTVIDKIIRNRVNIIAPCGYSALQDSKTLRWPQFAQYFNEFIPKVIPAYDAAIYHSSKYQDYEFSVNHGFKNSVVIPNGVGEDEFELQPKVNFREKYNIKTKYMGLCVANYFKSKGQDRIISELKKLKRDDLAVVFIGKEGEELNNLRRMAENLNIMLLANISREDTVAAYHQADLFLFGSHIEAFPLVILEAKASKTPFISTNCGNVKELKGGIVCGGEDEISVNINKLLDNESLRNKLAKEGYKEWKEKYTWEAVTDKYEDLYKRLYHKKFIKGTESRIKVIQSEIETDYSNISSYLYAAKLLNSRNNPEEAKKFLEDALELDYQNSEAEQLYSLISAS